LRAAVEHAVVLGRGEELMLKDLPVAVRSSLQKIPQSGEFAQEELNLAEVEASLIRKALAECGENRTLAAKKLGISRRTLHRHLAQSGIAKKAL
jgi:DNA-binding NtrC family response regulator